MDQSRRVEAEGSSVKVMNSYEMQIGESTKVENQAGM
jgi:hypothetical protein